jgi:HK97 family phage prohead protease
MNRAYSMLQIKSFDDEMKTISGWATTPAPDRVRDTINPLKAKFAPSMPLLHQHRHDAPVGRVKFGQATKRGIPFEASFPDIAEPGPLRDRVETARGEVKHNLVSAVSIGFMPLTQPTVNKDGGYDFDEIEIYELSLVTIPANAEAVITTVKSLDAAAREAAGIEDQPEIPATQEPAAVGKKARVVKLGAPARDGATPFVVQKVHRAT